MKKKSSKKIEEQIKKFNKRLLIMGISLLIIFIIGFSTLFIIANMQDPCSGLVDETEKYLCYYDYSLNSNSITYCRKITNLKLRESCIIEFAISNNDVSLCNDFDSTSSGYCMMKIAESRKDFSICDEITNIN
jgi:hypothetical protein